MSLAGSVTYWDNARKNSAAKESWLVKLFYDNEDAADYIGISDEDVTIDSIFYHGIVLDFGELTEKIDLLKSKASIGNVDIVCTNKFGGKEFSKELWPNTGTQNLYYINRKVEIYSRFGGATAIADCRLIYEGRLFNISQTKEIVTLHIEQKTPQDHIKIPNTKSTDGKVWFPVVYGNYTASGNSEATPTLVDNKAVWPIEVHSINYDSFICIDGINQTHNWHYYEKSIDQFLELEGGAGVVEAFLGGFADRQPTICRRGFILEANAIDPDSTDDWTNTENAVDGDETTDASNTVDQSVSGSTTITDEFSVLFPEIDGVFDNSDFRCRFYLSINVSTADGSNFVTTLRMTNFFNPGLLDTLNNTGTQADGWHAWVADLTDYQNNVPAETLDPLRIVMDVTNNDGLARNYTGTGTISNVQLEVIAQFDQDGSLNGSAGDKTIDQFKTAVDQVKFLYTSTDGYAESFTGGSGTATHPHTIFRDLLKRFASFDPGDTNDATNGYDDLDNDRDGTDDAGTDWDTRFWINKPEDLNSVLERLQFEGGFIYRHRHGDAKWIWVKDSYASADHNITANDYINLETSLTDFSDIITDVTWRYTKHPAKGDFINSRTYTNTAARAAGTPNTGYWPGGIVSSEENKTQIDLKYLVDDPYETGTDTNPNSCIALYYDNIWADPKILVSCEIINQNMFDLEVGDIVTFGESYIKHGKSTTVYYMVTETKRTIGNLSIVAREVYDA